MDSGAEPSTHTYSVTSPSSPNHAKRIILSFRSRRPPANLPRPFSPPPPPPSSPPHVVSSTASPFLALSSPPAGQLQRPSYMYPSWLFLTSTASQPFDIFPRRRMNTTSLMATRRDAEAELNLPPGFRFHPTDEELVVDYLVPKAADQRLPVPIIAEVNLYKFDPWELPEMALFGTKDWYFFTPRDRKYQNGSRPNRAAGRGYWKATGADKPISVPGSRRPVGVKKALVFYHGKAPRGVKTDWIMHEYRLADVDRSANNKKGNLRLDDCVLCRLYNKKNNWEKMMQQNRKPTDSFDTNGDARSDSAWSTKDSDGVEHHASAGSFQEVNAVKEEEDWFTGLNLDDFQSTMDAIGFESASVVSISNQDYFNPGVKYLEQSQSNKHLFWN